MELEDVLVNFTVTRGPIRGKDRNRVGLLIRVQARRDVEDFMSSLGNGRRIPIDNAVDAWQYCGPAATPLETYDSDTPFERQRLYTLSDIGGGLISNLAQREGRVNPLLGVGVDEVVNLSFLRLVGVSNESGVTVGILGAYSNDYIRRVKTLLSPAIKQFLQDYVVPISINLQVISRS